MYCMRLAENKDRMQELRKKSGRTEGNRLTDLAEGDAAMLTAEGNAPNLMGSGEISSPSKTP